jgi:hypothetical protein
LQPNGFLRLGSSRLWVVGWVAAFCYQNDSDFRGVKMVLAGVFIALIAIKSIVNLRF